MKRVFFSAMTALLAFAISIQAQTQKPKINFNKLEHDFGTFPEKNGPQSYTFDFVNLGREPIVIKQVQPSCGCTTPEFSHEPVLPGKKGFVKVTYDPANRPGIFTKTIVVNSNAENSVVVLTIKGTVQPEPPKLEEIYPVKFGQVRFSSTYITFGNVDFKGNATKEVELYNDSSSPLTLTLKDLPSCITSTVVPSPVAPGQKGVLQLVFDPSKQKEWGYVSYIANVIENGKQSADARISIAANIEENFAGLTPEQLAKAPSVTLSETAYNFGKVKQGTKISHVFTISNSGKSDLIIRSVKTSCGCTVAEPEKNLLKPGESTSMSVNFDSTGREGRQFKSVTIITNTPQNPRVSVNITGEVEL